MVYNSDEKSLYILLPFCPGPWTTTACHKPGPVISSLCIRLHPPLSLIALKFGYEIFAIYSNFSSESYIHIDPTSLLMNTSYHTTSPVPRKHSTTNTITPHLLVPYTTLFYCSCHCSSAWQTSSV